MRRQLLPAVRMVLVLTVLTGLLYPLAVAGIARAVFPHQADGSLVERNDRTVGSDLQGQVFTDPGYFHSRPSAAGSGYDGSATSGSNLGPTNEEFLALVERRVAAYRDLNGLPGDAPVPVDAVTASGSGLDPHISVANARAQAPRVAHARSLQVAVVDALVDEHTAGRTLGFLGEPRVNVLAVNLALDDLAGAP